MKRLLIYICRVCCIYCRGKKLKSQVLIQRQEAQVSKAGTEAIKPNSCREQ